MWHGRFRPGADRSGLSDPFVRIVCGPHSGQTQVAQGSLAPSWSRSLRLPAVRVCGKPDDLGRRPPGVIVEAWDRDACVSARLPSANSSALQAHTLQVCAFRLSLQSAGRSAL